MRIVKHWILLLVFSAMPAAAFDFTPSSANYDFTQTVEILIVDQKNSKFFAMRDPFEMLVTTTPSRFYVAVMGVLQRGHANADSVVQLQGAVADYEYVLIFRSLNSSHVMLIGQNWVVDGNKKIWLTAAEISAIYDLLTTISGNGQKMDLNILENLFKEINTQQDASINPKLTPEEELKSIIDSQKSIQERLPQSHDDMKTLPYYNKAEENRKFLEELNAKQAAAQKLGAQQAQANRSQATLPTDPDPVANPKTTAPVRTANLPASITPEAQASSQGKNPLLLGMCIAIGLGLAAWVGFRRLLR